MISTQLIALAFALSALANPIITIRDSPVKLSITKRFNATAIKQHNLVRQAQARARGLRRIGEAKAKGTPLKSRDVIDEPVVNQAVTYTAAALVGDPPTLFPNLLIDTGSSNTWVGATTPFRITRTTQDSGLLMEVVYGSGFVLGEDIKDKVDLGHGLVVQQQGIGAAIIDQGFAGLDGILGIGPVALTQGTTESGELVPTVTDNLFEQGTITLNQIGISFNPTNQLEAANGELTWGGVDSSQFVGDLTFFPVTSTQPASFFWGIDQSVTFGDTTILPLTAGIVDTGTTLFLLASDAFAVYQQVTGGVLDNNTGLLRITPEQFANLKNLDLHIGDTIFSLTPNAQIWPRALNTAIGGDPDGIFLITADFGTPSGQGLDFIDGFAFLERFYSVFDTTNRRIGFAPTANTNSEIN
ncbi:hypothetical protein ONZ45_g1526 [Pleurotus djamor]|nr:hypothetical protein ONZ45_g1526 [Pleurotus djamor]